MFPDSEFAKDSLALLKKFADEITVFSDDCGDTTWQSPDAAKRELAIGLLKKAEDAGILTLIIESPQSLAHLEFCLKGWCESPVLCIDIYTFVLEQLGGIE